MADGQLRSAIHQLRRLIGRPNSSTLTDAQLVDNFVSRHDDASFEVLVWRHGTMVLSLCQRILRDSHEAEDAFQASFLIFARKAASIGKREAVGSWLYKVAYRVALRARARTVRNFRSLDDFGSSPSTSNDPRSLTQHASPEDDLLWRELGPILDEEILRLPEKYRVPFVLCHLEGHTNEEAADQMGCPKGTILSRLSRGRERLRSRLVQRGVALGAAGVAVIVTQNASSAAVPAILVSSTIEAAIPFAAGKAAAGLVPVSVATLTDGVLNAMFLTKLKLATAALVALAVIGTGSGWIAHRALADNPRPGGSDRGDRASSSERPGDRGSASSTERPGERGSGGREDVKTDLLSGKVVDVANDGKSFSIEVPGPDRGSEPSKLQITIGDKTTVTYFNVGPDAAKPAVGYQAQVKLVEKGKDLASGVTFHGAADGFGRGGRVDVAGKVVALDRNGKGFTLEIPSAKPREEDPKRVEYKFNDKTVLVFSQVAKGGANLVEGLDAQIVLEDPQGNTPAVVHLRGTQQLGDSDRGGERRDSDVAGKVIAVGKDEKSITIEVPGAPPKERGQEPNPPTQVEVKIKDSTSVVYHNVGQDGTKFGEGGYARVWLASGSKDTAAMLSYSGQAKERWILSAGKVTAVSKDGNTITVEVPAAPPKERGEEPKPPTKMEFQINSKTRVAYHGISTGEAKPTEGYSAQVRADEGAKEAFEITFMKAGERGR